MTGPASLSASEVISTIFFPASSERSVQVIVWTFRLPVALMAIVTGITLGLAGANMQTILDNPLASLIHLEYPQPPVSAPRWLSCLALECCRSLILYSCRLMHSCSR
nr:iron chelate uptake ABC transporter family permease subunit [Methanosarcina barkeri]